MWDGEAIEEHSSTFSKEMNWAPYVFWTNRGPTIARIRPRSALDKHKPEE